MCVCVLLNSFLVLHNMHYVSELNESLCTNQGSNYTNIKENQLNVRSFTFSKIDHDKDKLLNQQMLVNYLYIIFFLSKKYISQGLRDERNNIISLVKNKPHFEQ